jgi:murein DD-endopeptidase MepM/ murein hydrolase activator NlpD/muramidase (phage lysozyme)
MSSNFPASQFSAPIVRCTIGGDVFQPDDGLMEARVFLGEGDRQSNCSFLLYDPDQFWANKYMKASYEMGGIEGLPLPTPPVSPGVASAGGGDFGNSRSQDTSLSPEFRAWLDTIAYCEGTEGAKGWQTIAGYTYFDGKAHPRRVGSAGSDASGRYQFLSTSWDAARNSIGLPDDMSPINQDKAAKALVQVQRPAALATMEQGLAGFDATLEEISWIWASIPPFRYPGQGRHTREEIRSRYQANLAYYKGQPQVGGTPAAPVTDNKPIDTIDLSKVPDAPAVKEISNKGQLIKIELGTDAGNTFEFVFTHIATAHQTHLNSTEFSGATIRWEMNRRLKNTAYQELTLKQLASSIAANYGLKLECSEDGPKFSYVDQTGISDYELLRRECDRVGWRLYEKGETLVLEPRKKDAQYLTLTYGQDIKSFRCEDRAQTDSAEQGRDFSQLSNRSNQGEAKAKIDPQRGEMIAEKSESQAAKGDGAIAATTGANVAPIGGTIKEESPLEVKDLSDVDLKAASDSDSAKRVKAFKSLIGCQTSPAILGLNPDKPILTEGFPGDFFNRMWVVGAIQHLYNGGLNSSIQLYTPLKPKPGINLGDSPIARGSPVAVATGKIVNPHSDGGQRGTPFAPGGAIRGRAHRGIDTIGDYSIRAGFSGTVIDAENSCIVGDRDCGGGFGNLVYIEGDGAWAGFVLRYAHLASAAVRKGDKVQAGQTIGQMGDTGASGGDHLHMELLQGGQQIDPEPLISPCFTGVYGQGAGTPLKCKA